MKRERSPYRAATRWWRSHPWRRVRSRTGDNPVGRHDELGEIGDALLELLFPVARSIRLLGISLSSLGAEEVKPETQFDLPV